MVSTRNSQLSLCCGLLIFLQVNIKAQDDLPRFDWGLVSGRLTLSPSHNFADGRNYLYLHGSSEVFLEEFLSFVGDGFYYLNTLSDKPDIFSYNHQLVFGMALHGRGEYSDLSVMIQPGLSLTKTDLPLIQGAEPKAALSPLMSACFNYSLYFHRNMHFFVQARYLYGQTFSQYAIRLSEFRISAGLGFQINWRARHGRNP